MTSEGQDSAPDDRTLILLAAKGDEASMDALVRRHQDALFCFVRRSVNNTVLARELAQETFVRAWFNAGKYRAQAGASVRTWLFAIALNLVRDNARRRSRWGRVFSWLTGSETPLAESVPDTQAAAPDEQTDRNDRLQSLEIALSRLPEKLRTPLLLCALEGMRQEEAAAIIGTTRKAVELRLRRAREQLRHQLARK